MNMKKVIIKIKRYLDKKDLQVAKESPFVLRVLGPFEASTQHEAFEKLLTKIKELEKNE